MTIPPTKPSKTSTTPFCTMDLGGCEHKIIFKPIISDKLKDIITTHVTPSMSSSDGEYHQYEPRMLIDVLNDNEELADSLSEHDIKVIKAINERYDYFEL